jgi:hypothetical protein
MEMLKDDLAFRHGGHIASVQSQAPTYVILAGVHVKVDVAVGHLNFAHLFRLLGLDLGQQGAEPAFGLVLVVGDGDQICCQKQWVAAAIGKTG